MTWKVAWSWQAEHRTASLCPALDGVAISSGMDVVLLDGEGELRWRQKMPFRIHGLASDSSSIAVLCGHGFHVLDMRDGSPVSDGRATPSGFNDILARPGGGWVLSCRAGNLHVYDAKGKGIRRLAVGGLRKLLGFFDREHLLWHEENGSVICARLTKEDSFRRIEERKWSWVSRMYDGRLLLQHAGGSLYEGLPHAYGWDSLEQIESRSFEPMEAVRCSDGWWILGIEGRLVTLSSDAESPETPAGDLLIASGSATMISASRDGLVRWWQAPHLAEQLDRERRQLIAETKMMMDWEARREVFQRAREAEDMGRTSLAAKLYSSLGREEDYLRVLRRLTEE